MLYAGHIKLFAETSELFTRTVFPLAAIRKKKNNFRLHPLRSQKKEAGEC